MKNNPEKGYLILGIVGIVAIVCIFAIGILVLGSYAWSNSADDEGNIAGFAMGGKTQTDTSKIWAELKRRGLQGTHYTLNIHGKSNTFNKADCTATPDPVTGEYGNNIFVPSYSDASVNNQILMLGGKSGGKWASTGALYGVRDTCTAPFDGDAAELVIPPSDKGYYVVARVLGKPTENPEIALTGDLVFVQDEFGNDLLVLGLVTSNGFFTPTQALTRTTGKVSATDITGLFEWSGSVCYFDGTNYCYDYLGNNICTQKSLCCTDTDGNGIQDSCVAPSIDSDGNLYCEASYTLFTMSCKDYTNEWVFNIGDFVGYMWDVYTDGNFKLVNIRFYPVQ